MKKLSVGLFILVAFMLYLLKQNAPQSENSVIRREPSNEIKKSAQPGNKPLNKLANQSNTLPPLTVKKDCAEYLFLQYPPSSNYLEEIRQKLDPIVGSWYYEKSAAVDLAAINETSTSGKFFLALAHAQAIEGNLRFQNSDPRKAFDLFQEVIFEDPSNSAPLVFAAAAYTRLGYKKEAAALVKKINQTTHFDSYLKNLIIGLYKEVRTPNDYVAAANTWGGAPIPSYRMIKELKINSGTSNILGNQLVSDGVKSGNEMNESEWIPIEYAYGKKILKDIGKGQQYPFAMTLIQLKINHFGAPAEILDEHECDPKQFENQVSRINMYFNNR
ncbi:MAG: tetratricopeptide repeat protein [Moraxellaceae bacterium]|nr:tetratricopeptide repeat protein [Pseudobdellovibrionaceae bacterium]